MNEVNYEAPPANDFVLSYVNGVKKTTLTFEGIGTLGFNKKNFLKEVSVFGEILPRVTLKGSELTVNLTTYEGVTWTEEFFVNKNKIRKLVEETALADALRELVSSEAAPPSQNTDLVIAEWYSDAPEEVHQKAQNFLDECWDALTYEVTVTVGETASEKKKREKKERKFAIQLEQTSANDSHLDYRLYVGEH